MSLTATAPAASARRATSTEKVSAEIRHVAVVPHWRRAPRSPGPAPRPRPRPGPAGPLCAATAPTSSMSKPASTSARPSATACSGVPLRAPSNIESTVTRRDRIAGFGDRCLSNEPFHGRDQRCGLVLGRHRRARFRRHRADVEHLEARLGQRQPVADRLLRGAAARALEHRVDGDVDDPGADRPRQVEVAPAESPAAHPSSLRKASLSTSGLQKRLAYGTPTGSVVTRPRLPKEVSGAPSAR